VLSRALEQSIKNPFVPVSKWRKRKYVMDNPRKAKDVQRMQNLRGPGR
jgi:hypothetical protein